jgi:putative nucleotidyltransferase with HDIG domain
VSVLAVAIARQMGLRAGEIEIIRLGALLHDIGKIGIGDSVLRKPGPLTTEEYEVIKDHARLGARILKSVPFLEPELPIVELHHERPDGRGYPHGLSGDDIPLHSRIVRVADAFDAMTTPRAYRPARPPSDAFAELWQFAGTQFDAAVVEALVAAWPTVSTRLHRVSGARRGHSSFPAVSRPTPATEVIARAYAARQAIEVRKP